MGNFGSKIRSLREAKALPLRTVAAYLDMDQAILSKIERGLRQASRMQVIMLANYLNVPEKELLVLWLADKVLNELKDEELAREALQVAEEQVAYLRHPNLNRMKQSSK